MFLDAFGTPIEVTPDNLHEYSYDLVSFSRGCGKPQEGIIEVHPQHGTKLLTSADFDIYLPPKWHGTIYSTEELIHNYRKRFNVSLTLFIQITNINPVTLLAGSHSADFSCLAAV